MAHYLAVQSMARHAAGRRSVAPTWFKGAITNAPRRGLAARASGEEYASTQTLPHSSETPCEPLWEWTAGGWQSGSKPIVALAASDDPGDSDLVLRGSEDDSVLTDPESIEVDFTSEAL